VQVFAWINRKEHLMDRSARFPGVGKTFAPAFPLAMPVWQWVPAALFQAEIAVEFLIR
jgi:hypothetical protein